MRLWKLDDLSRQCIYTLKGHKDYVWKLCELHDGTIASGSMDRTIKVWNIRYGRGTVPHCVRTLSGHSGFVRGVIEWQPGIIVSSSTNHQVLYVWDLNSSNNKRRLSVNQVRAGATKTYEGNHLRVDSAIGRNHRYWVWRWCDKRLEHQGRVCLLLPESSLELV